MPTTYTIPKYQTGGTTGTLSGIAQEHGVTVGDIIKANQGNTAAIPDPSNPNLITAGANLNIPDRQVQQTTSAYRNTTQENVGKFDALLGNLGAKDQTTQANKTTATTTDTTKTNPNDVFGVANEIQTKKDSAAKMITDINNKLDELRASSNAATNSLISSIQSMYQGRIAKMEDLNNRMLETKRTIGIREGRARYTPGVNAGILTDEEQAGQERIATLQGDMLNMVAKAEQARAENNTSLFNSQYDKISAVQKNLQDEVMKLYQKALDADKAIRDQQKAELDTQKQAFDQALNKAEAAAPAVVARLANLPASQHADFIAEYARRTGIDPEVLLGEVSTASSKQAKENLDIANIRSQISDRATDNAREDKKMSFNPTSDERTSVGTFLSSPEGRALNGGKPYTSKDLADIMNDPSIFYAVLQKAGGSELK